MEAIVLPNKTLMQGVASSASSASSAQIGEGTMFEIQLLLATSQYWMGLVIQIVWILSTSFLCRIGSKAAG